MRLTSYASDVLEDAMVLAQTKALNSFSFRDCLNTLTELWGYCYEKISLIDDGFYSTTMPLTKLLTVIPAYVQHTVKVYQAQEVVGYNRLPYKEAGSRDMVSAGTFHLSGNDLFCRDAELKKMWLSYVPEPPFITFTKNNRDPKILETAPTPVVNTRFGRWTFDPATYIFTNMLDTSVTVDLSSFFVRDGYTIEALILDNPYIFITYQNTATSDYSSYIVKNVFGKIESIEYNPFSYQGRGNNVKYITARFNDYTGMGCVIEDYDDLAPDQNGDLKPKIKEIGWTPDTLLIYPSRIMYNYLVSNIAKRFAAINNSQIPAVEEALAQSRYEMSAFLKKDKSGWGRIDNVQRAGLGDTL